MATQILTYPYGIKYQLSGWASQVKNGLSGALPCNDQFYEGKINVTTGGETWNGSPVGSTQGNFSQHLYHPFNQDVSGGGQQGLRYHTRTSSDDFESSRWYDFGAEGLKNDGESMNDGARSSWLREVTAVWFLFNGHDTAQARNCYASVDKVAIRYRDPNGRIRIKKVTDKIGDLGYYEGVRGNNSSDKKMFGYSLGYWTRREICDNDYRFLGLRIQIRLKRGNGSNTDTLSGGITGIRLGLGIEPNGTYNETAKRALVGRGNTTWYEFNNSIDANLFHLETR